MDTTEVIIQHEEKDGKRITYVDVGNLPREQAEEYIRNTLKKYKTEQPN